MKLYKRHLVWVLTAVAGSAILASCTAGGNDTGIEYAPNMYNSDAYEAYTQREEMEYNPNGMTMRLPVEGTIARGQLEYTEYSFGYEESASWTSKVKATESNVKQGEALFMTYCQHCHGKTGKNDGKVVSESEYPPPPFENFQTEYIQTLPMGKVFHTITYGKGNMGSHASQLNPEERWKVAHFVKSLSLGDAFAYEVDENAPEEDAAEESAEEGHSQEDEGNEQQESTDENDHDNTGHH